MIRPEELADRLAPLPAVWLSLEERLCLLKYAGLAKGTIIEIGTAFGGSACILTLGSDQRVFSVDPFIEPLCNVDGYQITAEGTQTIVRTILGADSWRWRLLKHTSEYVAEMVTKLDETFGNLPKGLVFIDGNHDYDYVKLDVNLWLPLIMKGGYLILHDSANRDLSELQYQGPHRVAAELKEDKRVKLLETAYSMTVWEVL